MKTIIFPLLLLCALSCHKVSDQTCTSPWTEAILPDSVQLGETVIYLNGELAEFKPSFSFWKAPQNFTFSFLQINGDIWNEFVIGYVSPETGNSQLYGEPSPDPSHVFTGFAQVVAEDLVGYKYKHEDSVDGFIEIQAIDSIEQTVKGRFKVAFCRSSKNGWKDDLGLPEQLLFQGVFFEQYEVQ